jgi:hypothetical protein
MEQLHDSPAREAPLPTLALGDFQQTFQFRVCWTIPCMRAPLAALARCKPTLRTRRHVSFDEGRRDKGRAGLRLTVGTVGCLDFNLLLFVTLYQFIGKEDAS